jgi:hydrogenase expression/formation protein HypE
MGNEPGSEFGLVCPRPSEGGGRIVMAHGGGGRLTQRLIEEVFGPAFANEALDERHDGARLPAMEGRLAMTTDSYVVRPLFFPGGSIGHLAVYGTVNDLAMCGAEPRYLSAGFILEEGLEMEVLRRVVGDMREAAARCGVRIVTGDTKVVERGKGDGVYVNTAGVGVIRHEVAPGRIEPGDAIVLSGDVGSHGIAIVAARDGLRFEAPVKSDAAPLWEEVRRLLEAGVDVHCLRDLTRGGFATALNELAQARGVGMTVEEASIPVREAVRGACELLGFDPLYVANEGRCCAFVRAEEVERVVGMWEGAVVVGRVEGEGRGQVVLRSRIGGRRVLDVLSGEQLPRIC